MVMLNFKFWHWYIIDNNFCVRTPLCLCFVRCVRAYLWIRTRRTDALPLCRTDLRTAGLNTLLGYCTSFSTYVKIRCTKLLLRPNIITPQYLYSIGITPNAPFNTYAVLSLQSMKHSRRIQLTKCNFCIFVHNDNFIIFIFQYCRFIN
jgi:hypothetical protein